MASPDTKSTVISGKANSRLVDLTVEIGCLPGASIKHIRLHDCHKKTFSCYLSKYLAYIEQQQSQTSANEQNPKDRRIDKEHMTKSKRSSHKLQVKLKFPFHVCFFCGEFGSVSQLGKLCVF